MSKTVFSTYIIFLYVIDILILAAPPWGAPVCFAKSSRQQFSVSGVGGVGFQIRSTVLKLKILYA